MILEAPFILGTGTTHQFVPFNFSHLSIATKVNFTNDQTFYFTSTIYLFFFCHPFRLNGDSELEGKRNREKESVLRAEYEDPLSLHFFSNATRLLHPCRNSIPFTAPLYIHGDDSPRLQIAKRFLTFTMHVIFAAGNHIRNNIQ